MNRREFLKYLTLLGVSVPFGNATSYGDGLKNIGRDGFPLRMLLIDAHAHPGIFPCTPAYCDRTSTVEKIKLLGMGASCFAGVGDRNRPTGAISVSFDQLLAQLEIVLDLEEKGKIKIVRRPSDFPQDVDAPAFVPRAILAVEGATPIGEDLSKIDELYEYGVRLITPMHYMVNAIGDIMTAEPVHGGLTEIGQEIVGRMISLGIVVDVAHAHFYTLQGIAEIARVQGVPIIDSHTSLTRSVNPYGTTRLRTLEEMEMIAETGGVVCTWPLGWWANESLHRTSFMDWARENLEIAEHIGFDHIGLGTDGGGGLPSLIRGYQSILDLPKLGKAMYDVVFGRNEIGSYMGGNLYRVIRQCLT